MAHDEHRILTWSLIIFVLTLAAHLVAASLPEMRLWGAAAWARVAPALWAAAVLSALVLLAASFRLPAAGRAPAGRRYVLAAAAAGLATVALFYLLRTKAHFLGDGYTALSLLADDSPLIKTREIGESLAHAWVKRLSGAEGEAGALFSFRFISIAAGALLFGAAAWSAARLFDSAARRALFVAGVMTGGYALLFFGYVENYSLFVASTGIYALVGLLVVRGQVARWWLLIPLAASAACHVLGVTLLPSAVYLLLAPTRAGKRLRTWRVSQRLTVGGLLLLVAGWAVVGVQQSHLFFRYSLVPPFEDAFTIGGYTLFSPAHLADLLNLLVLLLPPVGLLVLVIVSAARSRRLAARDAVFLIVLSLSALGAAFIFDPKLGMPRDWDLFAFAGIAPAVLLYVLTLDPQSPLPGGLRVAAMAVVLSLFALGGRLVAANDPPIQIARFNDYLTVDPERDRNARYLLLTYYKDRGDSAAADRVRAEWRAAFPLRDKLDEAQRLHREEKLPEATALFEQIVREDPTYADAWAGLGWMMVRYRDWDSAIACLDMSLGLNPYHAAACSNRGLAHLQLGHAQQAARDFERSLSIDPNVPAVMYNLAVAYLRCRRYEDAGRVIARMAAMPDMLAGEHLKLFEWYATYGPLPAAVAQLRFAIDKGADSAYVQYLLQRFPDAAKAFRR